MKRWGQMAAALRGLAALAGAAEARIVRVQIDRVEPFAGGMEFGATGSYVRIIGVTSGELDPREAGNRVIVNLDRASRNARGLVEYQVDFYVMRPTDAARGNRKILYMIAGTQHGGGAAATAAPGNCLHARNPHNPTPALRALLIALDRWVSEGAESPSSRIPTLAGGNLVAPDRTGFPAIPGLRVATAGNQVMLFDQSGAET